MKECDDITINSIETHEDNIKYLDYTFFYDLKDLFNITFNITYTKLESDDTEHKLLHRWYKNDDLRTYFNEFYHKFKGKISNSIMTNSIMTGIKRIINQRQPIRSPQINLEEFYDIKKYFYDDDDEIYKGMNELSSIFNSIILKNIAQKKIYKNIFTNYINKLNNDLNEYCIENDITYDDDKYEISINDNQNDKFILKMNSLLQKLKEYENADAADDDLDDAKEDTDANEDNFRKILFKLASYKDVIDIRISSFYSIFHNKNFEKILNLEKRRYIDPVDKKNKCILVREPELYDTYHKNVLCNLIQNFIENPLNHFENSHEVMDSKCESYSVKIPFSILVKEGYKGAASISSYEPLYIVFHKPRDGEKIVHSYYQGKFLKHNFESMDYLQDGLGGGKTKTKKKKKKRKKSRKKYKRNNIKRKKSRKKYKRNINTKKH